MSSKLEDRIRRRVIMLRVWTRQLAEELGALGARTFPTEGYFLLADFGPHDADILAAQLRERTNQPLGDKRLGAGYMRITTSVPENTPAFLLCCGNCYEWRISRKRRV